MDNFNVRRSMDRSAGAVTRGSALGLTLLLSVSVIQAAFAQQAIIIDPSSMPSGSPLSRDSSSGELPTLGQENSSSSSISSVSPIPAFKAGSIDSTTQNQALYEPRDEQAVAGRVAKPTPPNEFQNYVRSATGRDVKRFGADLLLPAPTNFNVPATSTIPGDYPIGIGDLVSVNTVGSIEGSADFTVDRNGQIFLPQVGKVDLAGVRYRDLKDRVAAAIGTKYRGFDVSVSIKRLHGIRVYVTGFANQPGAFTVNSLSTLVNAVMAAGGPAAGGSFRSIKLYRNGSEVRDFDLYSLLRNGDRSADAILQNEDVIFINPVGNQVAVLGSINEEAIYETRPGETIADVLRDAGGTSELADNSRVILYSLDDKGTVGSRQVALGEIAAKPIVAGDIVQVLSQGSLLHPLERQSVIVRLEGEVVRPGNYFVAPNTPLSQVVEQAGGLTSRAYLYGTRLTRVTVREQQRASYAEAVDQLEAMLVATPLNADTSIAQGDREAQMRAARDLLDKMRASEPDGRLVLDLPYSATTLPGDLLLENNDRIVVPPRIDTVGVFGAVYRPASFRLASGRKVRDFVERSGGPTRFADKNQIFLVRANGDVLSRKRGALNATVLPGDVIFVPVKSQSTSVWAKIRDTVQVFFQLGLAAATVAAIS
jgi:protein involved in polysaccharide export with SLBB domain